jgi:Uma2 family endonuclease
MTVTHPLEHAFGQLWTIDDLERLPDDGNRYEIFDGSLLVSPHADASHGLVSNKLRRLLDRQAPDDLFVGQDVGVSRKISSYLVPDLFVVRTAAFEQARAALPPSAVELVVEVLSPGNRGRDLVVKRHEYAAAGIPLYWIVDPMERLMHVLELDGGAYREAETVRPGDAWRTTRPFPISLDLRDVL